ncbi:hypothetical protein [Clostridium bornimense]|nr:hypothetical protein [Clostridium bornimense]
MKSRLYKSIQQKFTSTFVKTYNVSKETVTKVWNRYGKDKVDSLLGKTKSAKESGATETELIKVTDVLTSEQ